MSALIWKPWVHPHKVYKLEYPAHWDQQTKDEGRLCGFGPHDRENVGLWVSIMPYSIDSARFAEDLPKAMTEIFPKVEAGNIRRDLTMHDFTMKADMLAEGQGGSFWVIAGGDVLLFASTQVPAAERETWNPTFDQLLASLRVTRAEALFFRRVATEVLEELKKRYPEDKWEFDEKGIRGGGRQVYLGNINREVQAAPQRQSEIIKHFLDGLDVTAGANMGSELWEEIAGDILPVLKPRAYIQSEGPTKNLHVNDWLEDVIICYVIKSSKFFRFITDWDLKRWELKPDDLHAKSLANLSGLSWPKQMPGSSERDGGRLIIIDTNDSLASSRLLHPDLHTMFAKPLGSPFWAGVPDRNTLVLFSNRRGLKQRIGRQLKKDYLKSAYQITPKPFLVTPDGIARE